MLRERYRVIVQTQWDGAPVAAMVALHARRSADSVHAYRASGAKGGLAVMLTGTDLYRDLPGSREAAQSLDAADQIVVLQEDAPRLLSAAWRRKCRVIFQSAPLLEPAAKRRGTLRVVAVGHLRAEKDPLTLFRAIELLPAALAIDVRHIGAPLDEALGDAARTLASREPRYRYSGALARGLTRAALRSAHLLVHPSVVEGGANVVVEAITAGTPVLASRISGNVGMLGRDYPGYFEPRDASGLAECLVRAAREPAYLREMQAACNRRRPLFRPEAERREVHRLVRALLA